MEQERDNPFWCRLGDAVKLNWKLTAIAKIGDAYELTYSTPEGQKIIKTKTVALTVPAHVASSLLREINVSMLLVCSSKEVPSHIVLDVEVSNKIVCTILPLLSVVAANLIVYMLYTGWYTSNLQCEVR